MVHADEAPGWDALHARFGTKHINHGVAFSDNALAVIRDNAGGVGNFGGEPSPVTALYFASGSAATLNDAAGFTTGFSFYYSAQVYPSAIRVYSGVNDTGDLLATLDLPTTPNGLDHPCPNNPGANFCPLEPIGVAFAGTARSVDFGETVDQTVFDNITIGSATPVVTTPEPGAFALVGGGLVAAGAMARARRRAK